MLADTTSSKKPRIPIRLSGFFEEFPEKSDDQRDSADYYRVILPPDTNIDKDEYRVYDYYFNGKPKRVATSLTEQVNLVLDGPSIRIFLFKW